MKRCVANPIDGALDRRRSMSIDVLMAIDLCKERGRADTRQEMAETKFKGDYQNKRKQRRATIPTYEHRETRAVEQSTPSLIEFDRGTRMPDWV